MPLSTELAMESPSLDSSLSLFQGKKGTKQQLLPIQYLSLIFERVLTLMLCFYSNLFFFHWLNTSLKPLDVMTKHLHYFVRKNKFENFKGNEQGIKEKRLPTGFKAEFETYRVEQFLNPFEFPCLTEHRKNMLIHENL